MEKNKNGAGAPAIKEFIQPMHSLIQQKSRGSNENLEISACIWRK